MIASGVPVDGRGIVDSKMWIEVEMTNVVLIDFSVLNLFDPSRTGLMW